MLKILNDVYQSVDSKNVTLLVELDLSAAFDTIDPAILSRRLQHSFGLRGRTLNWVNSYLHGREQYVKCNDSSSTPVPVTGGVPQGSVLGPILFSLYIAPVVAVIDSFGISHHQYADDTQLYLTISSSNWQSKVETIESCLLAVHRWFSVNFLALNPDKTEAIILGTWQQQQRLSRLFNKINVAGTEITISESLKTLGVTFDQHLSFNNHVQSVSRACHYHIRALRHIRSFLTHDSAVTVACGIVSSRLDYCNSLLYGSSAENIQKLQRAQNTLARVVTGSRSRTGSTPLLQGLHWLPVDYRIRYKISSLTYKILHQQQPTYLQPLLSRYIPSRSLRSGEQIQLIIPRTNTRIGTRAFSVAAPTIWNSLPLNVRDVATLGTFQSHLKTHFFSSAYNI